MSGGLHPILRGMIDTCRQLMAAHAPRGTDWEKVEELMQPAGQAHSRRTPRGASLPLLCWYTPFSAHSFSMCLQADVTPAKPQHKLLLQRGSFHLFQLPAAACQTGCNSLVHDTVAGQPQHDLIQCRVGRGAHQHVGPLIALGSHRLQWGLVQQPIGVHPGGLICAVPGLDQVPAACTAALDSLFTAQLGLVHNA